MGDGIIANTMERGTFGAPYHCVGDDTIAHTMVDKAEEEEEEMVLKKLKWYCFSFNVDSIFGARQAGATFFVFFPFFFVLEEKKQKMKKKKEEEEGEEEEEEEERRKKEKEEKPRAIYTNSRSTAL